MNPFGGADDGVSSERTNDAASSPPRERVALVEHALVKAARRLARAHGLSDVAGLLGGASNRAAQMAWEEDQR